MKKLHLKINRLELMALWKREFSHLQWEAVKHASFAVNTVDELRAFLPKIKVS